MNWKPVKEEDGSLTVNVEGGGEIDIKKAWSETQINAANNTIITSQGIPKEKAVTKGIGDVKSKKKGSGARYNAGKANFSLIPLSTLEDEAQVWTYGERKYAAWNWAKGMAWSIPFACAMRHLSAWQRGEDIDKESGLPHLAHAMCNLRMLTLYSKTYKEGDDRPKEWMKGL